MNRPSRLLFRRELHKQSRSDCGRRLTLECLEKRLVLAAPDPFTALLSPAGDPGTAVDYGRADGTTAELSTVRVASGLSRPLFVTSPPGDTDRLFIVEQHTGRIKVLDLDTGLVNGTPFLDLNGLSTGNEQGLLGLAFHPDYATNGFFYVYFTDTSRATNIRRYQVSAGDSDLADPNSATTILTYSQPQSNHNGGWLGFGPDEYLYVSSGDGGGANDSGSGHTPGTGNAQDVTNNLLGKLLRLDVDGDDFPGDPNRNYAIPPSNPLVGTPGDNEIWAYGLRNPWRPSFDRATGDLYIADVGQNAREEINFQPAAGSGGENYGWRLREGMIATPTGGVGGPRPPGAIDPIYDYTQGSGPTQGHSVTGGYVYRGPIPQLQGLYFFADYVNNRIWSFRFDGSDPGQFDGTNFDQFTDWTELLVPDVGTINEISSFGEDDLGNLYIVDLGGEVFRIDAERTAEVIGRHVFYNNSAFDENRPTANAQDDAAIAPDKTAALPGEPISFANYTSYSRGINGIMVDIAGLPQGIAPGADDFEFRMGNTLDPSTWAPAPAPTSVTIRPGQGVDGSDRVTIIWPDAAIAKRWLQVTVLATADTWLPEDDVFYFGNAVGESGNSTTDAKVNVYDMLGARDNQRSFLDPAPIDFRFDYNRDARVNVYDMLIARDNQTHFLNALNLRLTEVVTALVDEGVPLSYHVPTSSDAELGTRWAEAAFDDSDWPGADQARTVLITEAGTADPDYVEIQNVSAAAADTSGWFVAVNDARDVIGPPDINAWHTTLWDLPGSMPSGEVLYRSDIDDGSGNWWGENIFWRTSGPGWVMIVDDSGEVADFSVWGYTEGEIDSLDVTIRGHHITSEESWNGQAVALNLDAIHSLQRTGEADHDNAADWASISPASMGEKNADLSVPFVPGIRTGIGFSSDPGNFGGAIRTDVGPQMRDVGASLWTRIPFDLDDPAELDELHLQIKYNDGFVAYLNGQEIARRNAPDPPQWNSTATAARSYEESSQFEDIDVTGFLSALQSGVNVLAIHGLNNTAADGDFVILPVLIGKSHLAITPGAPLPKTEVLEQAVSRESGRLGVSLAKLDWLFEFEWISTRNRLPEKDKPVEQAVDELLAMNTLA